MKRAFSFILAFMLLVNLMSGLIPKATAANWSDQYLQNLVSRKVMQGDKYGNLYPDNFITRAEFAALLNRAFGFTEKGTKNFKDVPATAWYAAEINIASNQGYMQGSGGGANPTAYLTREEAATMLCRALKIPSIDGEAFHLSDERNFSNWSRPFINAAVSKRFVNGYPDGSFKPVNNITRGEAAKMLSEVTGEIISSTANNAGRTVYGNLTISSSGVTLSNVTVHGDLYITEGVGLGYVDLKNVDVLGEVIISGAGESNVGQSSITLTNCTISNLTVDVSKRKILTLKTDGTTNVENTMIKSSTYLEELNTYHKGFDKVSVDGPSDTFLNLKGNFGEVRLISPGSTLGLYKGQVDGITVDEAAQKSKLFLEKDTLTRALYFDTGAAVTGTGKIESALINNDGTTIAQMPDNIYIRPGVTATINGKKMTSLDAEVEGLDPDFSSRYPKADLIQPTAFTEYYMTNKPGKVYYAVYPQGSSSPTTDQLMAKSGKPKDALKSGNLSSLPEKEVSVAISGLKAGTEYVVFSLFVDLRGDMSDIERTYVETLDNTVPVLLSGYPKISSIDRDRAMVSVIPNKNTSYYWAVLSKQAVAPTADQLHQQNVSGALSKGVTTGGMMNIAKDIDTSNSGANLLNESVEYIFYVVLRDSSGNMSKSPYKLNFTTKDLTPPSFYPEDTATEITYPKVGTVATTSIPFDYMVNESCTVYWAAAKMGTNMLPLGSDGNPDFTSQKSKDIVKSGTGAAKSGKASASAAKTKYTISVSGLEQQMPYDVYFMLEDKNGNQSDVKLVTAKTKDTTPPTASVSSAQEIGGHFSVDRPVSLTFSETVCSSETDASGNFIAFSKLFASDNTSLRNYIRLMDTTQVPEQAVTIDWSKVTVKDVDAKTVVTFGEGALPLANNNSYRFDLGYLSGHVIRDTSKNEMRSNTALPFKTVPPLTYFSEVKNIDSSSYDTAFLIRPDAQKTGAYIYFDVMLRSDYRIEFELYSSTTDIEDLTKVGTTHTLEANYATPLSSFVGQRTYESLPPTYYAIKLTKIGSMVIEDGKAPVTANVNLQMNAVIGNLSKLGALRGDAATFDTRLRDAINRGDVSSVTAPTDPFTLRIALIDSIPPVLDPATTTFTPGDTQVVMKVKPDKECDVYYLAMPVSEAPGTPPTESSIRTTNSNPARGIAAGSFHVPADSSVATEYTIAGLLPPPVGGGTKNYVIFYFLKGAAPSIGTIYQGNFATIEVASPKMNELRYTPETRSLKIITQWDSDCTVFYVVYPKGTFATPPTADQIMNPSKGPELIASGSFDVEKDTTYTELITSTTGLEYTSKYSFYAVAQKYIGSPPTPAGLPSSVVSLLTMSPRDTDPPAIAGGVATYTTPTLVSPGKFSGTVGVTFTEALYYFEQGSATAIPLTKTFLEGHLTGTFATAPGIPSYAEDTIDKLDGNGNPIPGQTEQCLRSVSFSYTNIASGTTIEFAKTIGDRALNYAGTLRLTFHTDPTAPDDPTKAFWTAQFIPATP